MILITERKNFVRTLDDKNAQLHRAYQDLKHAESQIVQREKMASIGVLAVGFVLSNLRTLQRYATRLSAKEVGNGTGPGLSVVYDIVRKHGGSIEPESEPGKGTTVTVRIPSGRPALPVFRRTRFRERLPSPGNPRRRRF